jgi:uncharacterized repeat protein (TIGR01451 family)
MRPNRASLALLLAAALLPVAAQAQPLVESFDAGVPAGWVATNLSSPLGTTNWFDGNPAVFGPQASTSYIAANFNATADGGTISDWLISPQLTNLQNGQLLTFYTRTETGAPAADRLQARLCLGDATACVNVGTLPADTGNFGTLLLDVNPAYAAGGFPAAWTMQSVSLSGLPAGVNQGRFAFRHMAVVSGPGPTATGGDYVGVDSVTLSADLPVLAITKSASNPIPPLAAPFTYQVVVSNNGAAAATAVSITDDVPAGLAIGTVTIVPSGTCNVVGQLVSCTVPVLAAGTSVTVTIPVTASAAGVIDNTASVSAAGITAIQASASVRPGAASTVPSLSLLGLILLGLSTALAALLVLGRVR